MSIAHPDVLERIRREGFPNVPSGPYTGGVDPTIVQGGPVPPEMIPRIDTWPTSLPRGRTNQAPRPEGFQRAVTGLADYITGNKWDFDQRGRGGSNQAGDPGIMMETIPRRRQWNAPDDLTVSQGAEQGVRRGGGILNRIGDFLGRLGVPGSPEAPADMQGTQMVRDPQTGEWVHPNVLKHWSRQ